MIWQEKCTVRTVSIHSEAHVWTSWANLRHLCYEFHAIANWIPEHHVQCKYAHLFLPIPKNFFILSSTLIFLPPD